jgi:SAM-dependent methyltransferase
MDEERKRFYEQEVAESWDRNADTWAEMVRRGWDVYREHFNNPAFFRFIGDLRGKRVLDAGCGEGYNTRLMARAGAGVVGVDISPRMIELAREEEKREPLGIRYEIASFSELGIFPGGSFDAVVSFMALMDGADLEGAFREFFRVLRQDGELAFSVTHPCFLTEKSRWITDEEGNTEGRAVSGYFDSEPFLERWCFSQAPARDDYDPFQVPCFPRTLSDYLNPLVQAGFTLLEIAEPRPSEEACQEHDWLRRWREHVAMFLYVRAARRSVS